MGMQTIENLNEYHQVMAGTITTILNQITNLDQTDLNKTEQVKNLIILVINYVFTQYMENEYPEKKYQEIKAELDKLELKHQSLEDLAIIMAFYQAKAKMKPVQITERRARLFEQIRGKKF